MPLLDEPPAATRDQPLSVPELLRRADVGLARTVGTVWVEGELAEFKRPVSGHAYFTVRDRDAAVGMVMWRSDLARQRNVPTVGQRVRVRGKLGVFPRDGRMQFYADVIEPAGLGEAAAALARLKAQLLAEGLFAPGRKRPLPRYPRRVGVVTSAQGAAVQDIIRTIGRRFPVPILVADCAVQGPSAPEQIVAALVRIARHGVDVIIVGRGGGSAGDLAAFNDERVVRAIAACPVPVVSAVGHEVDLSLADLVADTRASTPTAAAELVVPVRSELAAALEQVQRRLHRDASKRLASARQELDHEALVATRSIERRLAHARALHTRLERRLAVQSPRAQLAQRRQTLTELTARLAAQAPGPRLATARVALHDLARRASAAEHRGRSERLAHLTALGGQLHALSPLAVLGRGFAVVRRVAAPQAGFVRAASQVTIGDLVDVRVADGAFTARVESMDQP